jgi:hypothetical protein
MLKHLAGLQSAEADVPRLPRADTVPLGVAAQILERC